MQYQSIKQEQSVVITEGKEWATVTPMHTNFEYNKKTCKSHKDIRTMVVQ